MINHLKKIDAFSRNIAIVFLGSSLLNVINLIYQLYIAHKLTPPDFASFNSLLAIFMVISSTLATLQTAVAKYTSEYRTDEQRIKKLVSGLLKYVFVFSLLTFFIFFSGAFFILDKLKIPSLAAGYILALLLISAWINPVLSGALQGLEYFSWFTSISVITGLSKLALTFLFIWLGFNIAGALGALLSANIVMAVLSFAPVKNFIDLKAKARFADLKHVLVFLLPVAISTFCYYSLISMDMIVVKYYFSAPQSGLYAVAQMVGKIFVFLPGAISMVLLPHTSNMCAKKLDCRPELKRSLSYAVLLCTLAFMFYNAFPAFTLKVLTGKAFPESILLGRFFSFSMANFSLLFVFITYFLSIKDFRFIKYLVLFAAFQVFGIISWHPSLVAVQAVLCVSSGALNLIHLFLAFKKK